MQPVRTPSPAGVRAAPAEASAAAASGAQGPGAPASPAQGLRRLVKEYLEAARNIVTRAYEDPNAYPYRLVRDAIALLTLGPEGLERELRRLAACCGGCVSCRHSTPVPDHLSLAARYCKLGLAQDTCKHWEPLLGGEEGD